MPRTKYLVVFCVVLIAFLILVGLFSRDTSNSTAARFIPPQEALALSALEKKDKTSETVLTERKEREENRRTLIEKLRNYDSPMSRKKETPPPEETPREVPVPTPTSKEPQWCADGSVSGSGIAAWGEVTMVRAEGARVIASTGLGDTGLPLHTLELQDVPQETGAYTCLPQGMVGIGLDGRVIFAGQPFSTSAEGLAGYALDGFGIFGTNENGAELRSNDLDACHGHAHPIIWNGAETSMYHYHVTSDSPYTLGCYRGVPSLVD